MSGTGRSDGTPSGSGGAPAATPCAMLSFTTLLQSPNPPAVSTLRVGDVLEIRLEPKGFVAVVTSAGDIAGSIVGVDVSQLIACIRSGMPFIAQVLAIQGGACRVEIRPK